MKLVSLAAAALMFTATLGAWAQQAHREPTSLTQATTPAVQSPRQLQEIRGDILVARKLYPDAIAVYLGLLQQEPRNAPLLNKIGIAYQKQVLLRESERYYRRAMKADKTFVGPVNNLGTVAFGRQKYGKAIGFYKKALKLQPDLPVVYSNLGYAYLAMHKYPEALASFRRTVQLNPNFFEERSNLGSVVEERSFVNMGLFYFLVAKSYALQGDAGRCARYLKMSRDEGYNDFIQAQKDPAFAGVLKDPRVRELVGPSPATPPTPPSTHGV